MLAVADSVWQTLITVCVGAAVTIILAAMAQRNRNAMNERADSQDVRLREIHKLTNGMSERLQKASEEKGQAEGKAAGLAQGRQEKKDGV